ncbi:MAG: TetR/AcrR family transcriptional regulator [Candidatus Zixiibacteriota bacterium]
MTNINNGIASPGQKRTDTKERILKAAAVEFAKNGLAGARVDRIAAAAKVNKAMIYYHFSSKEKLYREVITDRLAQQLPTLRSELTGESGLESTLKNLLDFHVSIFFKEPSTIQLFLRELADPSSEIVKSIAKLMKDSGLPNEFVKALSAGARSGALRAVDGRQAMISFIAMSIGFFLMSSLFDKVWQFTNEPTFIEERKAAILDLFMNGVKAR